MQFDVAETAKRLKMKRDQLNYNDVQRANDGIKCMQKQILEYNEVLKKCGRFYVTYLSQLMCSPSANKVWQVRFDIQLKNLNNEFLSDVVCEVRYIKAVAARVAFDYMENPRECLGYLIVGSLDSETLQKHQGHGYNKFLRTYAYSIMRRCFGAHIIATNAISAETLHVLTDYFAFSAPVEVRNDLIDRAIRLLREQDNAFDYSEYSDERYLHYTDNAREKLIKHLTEQKGRNIVEDARSNKLLKIINGIDKLNYNMISDLTSNTKNLILQEMESQIFKCECPPCKKPTLLKINEDESCVSCLTL